MFKTIQTAIALAALVPALGLKPASAEEKAQPAGATICPPRPT